MKFSSTRVGVLVAATVACSPVSAAPDADQNGPVPEWIINWAEAHRDIAGVRVAWTSTGREISRITEPPKPEKPDPEAKDVKRQPAFVFALEDATILWPNASYSETARLVVPVTEKNKVPIELADYADATWRMFASRTPRGESRSLGPVSTSVEIVEMPGVDLSEERVLTAHRTPWILARRILDILDQRGDIKIEHLPENAVSVELSSQVSVVFVQEKNRCLPSKVTIKSDAGSVRAVVEFSDFRKVDGFPVDQPHARRDIRALSSAGKAGASAAGMGEPVEHRVLLLEENPYAPEALYDLTDAALGASVRRSIDLARAARMSVLDPGKFGQLTKDPERAKRSQ